MSSNGDLLAIGGEINDQTICACTTNPSPLIELLNTATLKFQWSKVVNPVSSSASRFSAVIDVRFNPSSSLVVSQLKGYSASTYEFLTFLALNADNGNFHALMSADRGVNRFATN